MRNIIFRRLNSAYLLSAVAFAVLVGMFFTGLMTGYAQSLVILLMVYIAIAISWSILGGHTGEFSFGQMGFFGIGSYTVALLGFYTPQVIFPLNILAGGGTASLLALVAAYPLLRIRGWYFAIGTFAFAEILRTLTINYPSYTKGLAGAFLKIPTIYTPTVDYMVGLIIGFGVIISFYKLINCRLGLALHAVRDNYDAAKMMGINTTLYRSLAFIISAFIAGLAGGYFAMHKTYIDPYSAYETSWIFKMIVMAVIGGASTFSGPILGAVIVLVFEEIGRTFFLRGYLLLLAFILVIAFIFMPGGIVGAITKQSPLQNPFKRIRRLRK